MINYNRDVNPNASNSHINSKSERMKQKRLPGKNWECTPCPASDGNKAKLLGSKPWNDP